MAVGGRPTSLRGVCISLKAGRQASRGAGRQVVLVRRVPPDIGGACKKGAARCRWCL